MVNMCCTQMIDIRPLFDAEISKGKASGPMFVNGWPSDRDPRFCEPVNPLYDPLASRDTDWRSKLDIVSYLRFSDYVAHVKGMLYRYVIESAEDEAIFNVSFQFYIFVHCLSSCICTFFCFYRAMLRIAQYCCRILSVCLSVCLV